MNVDMYQLQMDSGFNKVVLETIQSPSNDVVLFFVVRCLTQLSKRIINYLCKTCQMNAKNNTHDNMFAIPHPYKLHYRIVCRVQKPP